MNQTPVFAASPRAALDLRRKLLNWWVNPSQEALDWLVSVMPTPEEEMARIAGRAISEDVRRTELLQMISRERYLSQHGELYLVTDEMTEIARAAALTLPAFAIEREDFPSESGLIIFHHAPVTRVNSEGEVADFVAASWWHGMNRGIPGVQFNWYEDRDGGDVIPSLRHQRQRVRETNRAILPRLLPSNWAMLRLGTDFTEILNTSPLLPVVLSAFLLMQQPLAARERVRPAPLDGRRARRAGIDVTDITVVKLRHLKTHSGAEVVRPREYRNRWIVRGHWRNQWLPSRGVHRPTWITPHIKGPEHAPIKVTEKVNVWSR